VPDWTKSSRCALNTSAKLTRNVIRNVSRLPSALSRPILTRQRCRCVPFLPTKPQPCSTPATPSPPAPNRHLHLDTAFTRTGWAQTASQLAATFLLAFSPNISTVGGFCRKSRTYHVRCRLFLSPLVVFQLPPPPPRNHVAFQSAAIRHTSHIVVLLLQC
jgi:hypothetical protein